MQFTKIVFLLVGALAAVATANPVAIAEPVAVAAATPPIVEAPAAHFHSKRATYQCPNPERGIISLRTDGIYKSIDTLCQRLFPNGARTFNASHQSPTSLYDRPRTAHDGRFINFQLKAYKTFSMTWSSCANVLKDLQQQCKRDGRINGDMSTYDSTGKYKITLGIM